MTETIYHVVPQKNSLFAVEMTPPNGRFRQIPDFRDKADADAWIVQTERMLHGLDPVNRLCPAGTVIVDARKYPWRRGAHPRKT